MDELILEELLLLGVEKEGLLAGCRAVVMVVPSTLSVVLIHGFLFYWSFSFKLSGFAKTLSFLFY